MSHADTTTRLSSVSKYVTCWAFISDVCVCVRVCGVRACVCVRVCIMRFVGRQIRFLYIPSATCETKIPEILPCFACWSRVKPERRRRRENKNKKQKSFISTVTNVRHEHFFHSTFKTRVKLDNATRRHVHGVRENTRTVRGARMTLRHNAPVCGPTGWPNVTRVFPVRNSQSVRSGRRRDRRRYRTLFVHVPSPKVVGKRVGERETWTVTHTDSGFRFRKKFRTGSTLFNCSLIAYRLN